ncbi:hypothetical protein J5X84_02685 [Streptosporangiaceae bacterium NEAU-GS5]|nr:hypothetical protein [Streptosporangiaceae bacterium NEAU-GS5]
MNHLAEAVDALSRLEGETETDYQDEHARWHLYLQVLSTFDASRRQLLYEALSWEGNKALRLSVVLRILELVPAPERDSWLGPLPDAESRTYAEQRMRDLEILDQESAGQSSREPHLSVPNFSDWLQLRLAQESGNVQTLRQLAESGRTKRIRRLASERIRVLPLGT